MFEAINSKSNSGNEYQRGDEISIIHGIALRMGFMQNRGTGIEFFMADPAKILYEAEN